MTDKQLRRQFRQFDTLKLKLTEAEAALKTSASTYARQKGYLANLRLESVRTLLQKDSML